MEIDAAAAAASSDQALVQIYAAKDEESKGASDGDDSHGDSSSQGSTSNDCHTSAARMARNCTERHQPVVLSCRHGYGGDLTPVSPFAEEGHDECLHPRWTEHETEQILQTCSASAPRWRRTSR